MIEMAERHLEPHHIAKAYLITVGSIQRDAIFAETLKKYWPEAPYPDGTKVRPEDAMARILSSTSVGRHYLADAAEGRLNQPAAKTITRWMAAWGLDKTLYKELRVAPDLAVAAPEVERIIRTADRKTWMQFVADNAHGIGYAKAGFLASLLGRGDLATADARELGLWREDILANNLSATPEVVAVLNKRLRDLRVQVPDRLKPFYEHLVHHAVWDAVGGQAVLHQEIQNCMRGSAPARTGRSS